MRAAQLAERYAAALRIAIGDPARLEAAAEALHVLSAVYLRDAELRYALANPVVPGETRGRILDAAVAAQQAPPEVGRLLHTLLAHNRMAMLPFVAGRFEQHIDEWLNRVEVTVVTALPLTEPLRSQLIGSLGKFAHRSIRLQLKVDPKILGGILVLMWGVFIDFSLRTRLARLRQKLLMEETVTHGH